MFWVTSPAGQVEDQSGLKFGLRSSCTKCTKFQVIAPALQNGPRRTLTSGDLEKLVKSKAGYYVHLLDVHNNLVMIQSLIKE
jgi:hypothetical protein